MPGGCWSAAYLAAPVTLSTPSRRVNDCPIFEPCRTRAGVCESMISVMGNNSGNGGNGRTGERRQSLGRAGGSERECPLHDASCKFDLDGVVARGPCFSERDLGGATKDRRLGRRADENSLGFVRPPRLQSDAAEGEPRIRDQVRLDAQRRRC